MKTYSLNAFDVNIFGIDVNEDVGTIKTAAVGPVYSSRAGSDGTTTVSENKGNANRNFELEIGYGSITHALLSAFYNVAQAAGVQAVGGPMVIKDRQGTSIEMTISAFLEGFPDVERKAESGMITWKGQMVQPTVFFGGLPG
jgi:hypothetical protein